MKKSTVYIIEYLKKKYPNVKCSLEFTYDYELLFATRLSAQCTDARVNIVTKQLFSKYKTLKDYANADISELEAIVKPCGFYKNKALSIKKCAATLVNEYGGQLPDSIDELIKLSGIGRKTANLIMAEIFNQPAIIADTHCIRLANRLALATSANPDIVEKQLKAVIDKSEQTALCHRFVAYGRDVCKAQNPKCEQCGLQKYCIFYKDKNTASKKTK